ncbi:hypothetical protein RJ640_021954, partial [Escallonia rubra]
TSSRSFVAMATAVQAPLVHPAAAATPPVTPHAAVAAAGGGFGNVSLYVGDLEATVNDGQLYDLFNQVAQVTSVRVCRDQHKHASLGYAYVNFSSPQDAATAMEVLNFTPVNGKPIRIMYSHRDPSIRKSGYANIFIKNLDSSIDNKALHDTFASFGTVLSCKVANDGSGQSKGYGFVQFDQDEAAQNAIKQLNGMLLNGKKVYVGPYVRRQERLQANGSPKFTNIYVKNLPETITDEDLENMFGKYGSITSAVVMKDGNGKSRCFGFVNFQEPDGAAAAVENLNGTSFKDDKILFVGKAQRKSERDAELRAKFEQERISRFEKLQGANLYMKNLDDSINDEKLKDLFSEFGTVTSCKVMLDPQGVSKGSGFVAFSTPEEATRALNEMNGKMIGRKPLYVAVAQRKEERRVRLQVTFFYGSYTFDKYGRDGDDGAQFAQVRPPPGTIAHLPTGMPGFHPGAPRLAPQQLYFGQGTPGMIPPQPAGYGFQQQLLPGMRPGIPPNFIMPYHLQRPGQPGPRLGVRRGGNTQQMQHQVLYFLKQYSTDCFFSHYSVRTDSCVVFPLTHTTVVIHRNSNQGYSRYISNGRNGMDPSMVPQTYLGQMMPMSYDASAMPATPSETQRSGPVPMSKLASALASATPEEQRRMLGEQLYPLVERLEHENVGKVTGMLLEMDQTEVLHLIEAPDALKKKVGEAMDVLRSAALGPDVGDKLGSLSLSE